MLSASLCNTLCSHTQLGMQASAVGLADGEDKQAAAHRRGLLQGSGALITVVATADQLKSAITDGARHIEIRDHLDLRSLTYSYSSLFYIKSSTNSIRVSEPPFTCICTHL
jgi:hypothetical protein